MDDFLSQKAKGVPLARPDPEALLMYDGISVYATETQARTQVRAKPWIGRYVAVLHVTKDGPITFRRTGVGRGHHTLWGDPSDLLRRVVDVLPI